MKKVFTIIISIILVSLIGLGITGYYVEKDKADNKKEDIKTETQAEQVEEKLVVDINKLDISKLDGYTPGEKLNGEEQSVNTDENTVTVGGISLPYNIEKKKAETRRQKKKRRINMKTTKKILAILIAVITVFGILSVAASADDKTVYIIAGNVDITINTPVAGEKPSIDYVLSSENLSVKAFTWYDTKTNGIVSAADSSYVYEDGRELFTFTWYENNMGEQDQQIGFLR